jgi:hypothetical protein
MTPNHNLTITQRMLERESERVVDPLLSALVAIQLATEMSSGGGGADAWYLAHEAIAQHETKGV